MFGPKDAAILPLWLGVPVVGAFLGASMMLPKLIQKEIDGAKAQLGFLGAMALVSAAACLGWKLPLLQAVYLIFFSYLYFYFGFLMPQKHIRSLDWARYLTTMFLVVTSMGVLLKMGARLAFNIKYVLTLPQFNLNF